MKAYVLDRYGRKGHGAIRDMPEPALGEHDVLVEIHAAGVNPLDAKIAHGEFKLVLPYRLPLILGNEMVGVVRRVGARVTRFKSGDAVYGRPGKDRIGTFANYIAVNEADIAAKPDLLTMEQAASLPLVALTAWQVLVERANLQKGQRVFIQAGSGGVGTIAIQLAKHLGAFVATTTSSANIGLVKSLGADVVIDYGKEDVATVLRDYDVVLHSLGADQLEQSLRILKPGGKLISISGPPDADFAMALGMPWPMVSVMRLLSYRIRRKAKQLGVHYSFVFMRAQGDQLQQIATLVDSGAIRPVLDRVFPFESTSDALAYVETGRAKGKVVVSMKPSSAGTGGSP